ncbi:MAG: ATP-binding protein [Erysipelotrichaceae bacterium]
MRDIFITRKEFTGSIYEQIDEAYEFVLQNINLGSRIEGVARQDFYELPIKAIREIISNAVCHRSYLTPGKIQVALFDDRLEVTSSGMLDSGITIEKMKTGLSKIRNKGIAAAFSYMNVVEAWDSGIPKIFREAKEYGLTEPELLDMGSDFRVNIYRKSAVIDQNGVINSKDSALSGNPALPDYRNRNLW